MGMLLHRHLVEAEANKPKAEKEPKVETPKVEKTKKSTKSK